MDEDSLQGEKFVTLDFGIVKKRILPNKVPTFLELWGGGSEDACFYGGNFGILSGNLVDGGSRIF